MRLPFPLGALAGVLLLAACRGTEPEPVVTSVSVVPGTATIEVGGSVTLAAEVRDQRGNPLGGRPVSWTSQSLAIASVAGTGATGASGVVTGVGAGMATIVVSVDGETAQAVVVVTPLPVASIAIVNQPALLVAGQTAVLGAVLTDRLGNVLAGRTVDWTSSSPDVATVDYTGLVRAVSIGTTTITARSEGVGASIQLAVSPPGPAPTVSAVAPAVLVPGQSATIAGAGFDPLPARNTVMIGAEAATVTAASASQLTVTVPCVPSGAVEVRVTSNGAAAVPSPASVAVPQRTLAVGQSMVLGAGAAACNELTGSGAARYVVSVFSASTSPNAIAEYELAGNPAPAGQAAPRFAPLASRADARPDHASREDAARDAAHYAMLERDRAAHDEGLRRAARLPAARTAALRAPLPEPGEMRGFFYAFSGGCSDTTRVVRAKAIYIGTRAVIWEDSTNTLQSSADAPLAGYYARLGQIFDQDQYDVIRETFGDPLRRDALTDGDGRVHMVFTQRLNGSGAAAYVTGCDQQPRTVWPASNVGEYFYGAVPTTSGTNLSSTNFPDGWFYFMARTVVHEVKHIASSAARTANAAPSEQTWLEEGTARHAEEVWVRRSLHRIAWKSNADYGTAASNGLYCDFHPENATCNQSDPLRRPSYGMRRQFNELREKLLQPWNWSLYGDGNGQSGSVFYQTVWSLVRYAIDRHGASDAAFLGALTNASVTGGANLAAAAGVTMDQLVGNWTLALYLDDHPALGGDRPDVQMPSWNLRGIYAGLNADPTWTARWSTPFPIQPLELPFGAFTTQQTGMRGGANAYYVLSGTMLGPQLLRLRGTSGGAAPGTLRVAVARIQ